MTKFCCDLRRRTLLAGVALAAMVGLAPTMLAQNLTGELVILQW